MTVTEMPERGVRYWKAADECRGDRHRPEHKSFTRGCTCPDTVKAEEEYQRTRVRARRMAPGVKVDVEGCPAKRHTATYTAWRDGCRCPQAEAAAAAWREKLRVERLAAIEHHRVTGECGARRHDSLRAFRQLGCRCDLAIKLGHASYRNKITQPREGRPAVYPTLRPVVGRVSLMMLLAGYPDKPTRGEGMVAVIRLSQVRVPFGPTGWRGLDAGEMAARLGYSDNYVYRARRDRVKLRSQRTERRLQDVRAKAERVARAMAR